MNFAQIDPAKILNDGTIGLSFLLALLAYFLLQREQRAPKARDSALKSIKEFMIFAVAVACLGLAGEIARPRFASKPANQFYATAPVPCSAIHECPCIGKTLMGLAVGVGILFLAAAVLLGTDWALTKAVRWLSWIPRIVFDICLFVLWPLCVFRKTRSWAGTGFFIASQTDRAPETARSN
jgi:hypothetical protein